MNFKIVISIVVILFIVNPLNGHENNEYTDCFNQLLHLKYENYDRNENYIKFIIKKACNDTRFNAFLCKKIPTIKNIKIRLLGYSIYRRWGPTPTKELVEYALNEKGDYPMQGLIMCIFFNYTKIFQNKIRKIAEDKSKSKIIRKIAKKALKSDFVKDNINSAIITYNQSLFSEESVFQVETAFEIILKALSLARTKTEEKLLKRALINLSIHDKKKVINTKEFFNKIYTTIQNQYNIVELRELNS